MKRLELKQKPICQTVKEKQLKWIKHEQRIQPERITKQVVEARRRGKGRPKRQNKNIQDRMNEIAESRGKQAKK